MHYDQVADVRFLDLAHLVEYVLNEPVLHLLVVAVSREQHARFSCHRHSREKQLEGTSNARNLSVNYGREELHGKSFKCVEAKMLLLNK